MNAICALPTHRIYLDLDETLLLSERISLQPEWADLPGAKRFNSQGEPWVTFCRPYALEMVRACLELADTYYLTTGGAAFQSQVLQIHGFPKLPLYTSENYGTFLPAERVLLVDDTDILGLGIQDKMRRVLPDVPLPYNRNLTEEDPEIKGRFKLIQVPFWAEPNLKDAKLLEAIESVKRWHTALRG
jgi:hypothetical protein